VKYRDQVYTVWLEVQKISRSASVCDCYTHVVYRHEESIVDGRREEIDDPFISGRAAGGGGMTLALVDDILDLLADYCNSETVLIILFTVTFAIFVELFCTPHVLHHVP